MFQKNYCVSQLASHNDIIIEFDAFSFFVKDKKIKEGSAKRDA